MNVKLTYRAFHWVSFKPYRLAIILAMASGACNQKEQKHQNHELNSTTSMQRDSMESMNHANKDLGHEKMNMPAGAKINTDSNSNENYWNSLPTNRTVIARQKVVAPVFREMNFTLSGNGYIAFDMRRNRKIPVRTGGRIERLFVKYNYQYVRKGEKILELYSPELNTYIEEYLYIRKQTTDSVLQARSRQKLLLLGLSSSQLKQIDQRGSTSFAMAVYSPFDGYVLFNPSAILGMGSTGTPSGGMDRGMSASNNTESSIPGSVLSDNSIREGMYVSKDQTLFWINDFKVAWGIIAFGKENEKYLRKGQPVTITSELLPDKPIQSSIQLIEQVYQDGQKFTQARVNISNTSGMLKQNSLITASVSVPVRSLMVPASSVYYLGKAAIVWVQVDLSKAGSYIFQSKVVKTGHRSSDQVEILEGLQQNDKIAKDAGYLTDSESIINH